MNFFSLLYAISPYELLSKIWGYVCTEERGPPQDPIMWQLSMMIKFFLFSEEDQNLGLWMTCTLLTLKRFVEQPFFWSLLSNNFISIMMKTYIFISWFWYVDFCLRWYGQELRRNEDFHHLELVVVEFYVELNGI